MRKDIRPSLLFRTESDGKLGGAWEQGYPAGAADLCATTMYTVPAAKTVVVQEGKVVCTVNCPD